MTTTTETTYRYTVMGSWPFPTDMLRRDRSGAASLHDEESLSALSGDHAGNDGEVRIRLAGECLPNIERWESSGWKVVEGDEAVRREMRRVALIKAAKAAPAEIKMGTLPHDGRKSPSAELVA